MSIELKSFASVAELQDIWKPLALDEQARAEKVLLQISNFLRLIGKNNHINLDDKINYSDPDGVFESNVKMVVLNAAQRVLAQPSEMVPDATAFSQSASPYSESMNFGASGNAGAFFKDKELKLLGLFSLSGKSSVSLLRGVRG